MGNFFPAAILADQLERISERFWCAGWMDGLEYDIWRIANSGGGEYGFGEIEPDYAADLIALADKAGGWWAWDDEKGDIRFVEMDEWLEMYEGRNRGRR
jgi:hypothetical protein